MQTLEEMPLLLSPFLSLLLVDRNQGNTVFPLYDHVNDTACTI